MQHSVAIALAMLMTHWSSAQAESASTSLACESQERPGDRLDFSCPLPASTEPRRFRFTANFAGGHDDTMAQLVARLDGQHLTCEPESKVSLMAEEGEVSLFCLFTSAVSESPRTFQLELSWSHAQYLNSTLRPE